MDAIENFVHSAMLGWCLTHGPTELDKPWKSLYSAKVVQLLDDATYQDTLLALS